MVVFGQKWFYSGKSGCTQANLLFLGQSGSIRAKVVVIVRKWFYSGKSCYIWAKLVVFGQTGCIRAKVVVFG